MKNRHAAVVLAAAVLWAGLFTAAGPADATEKGRVGVELNKLETAGQACRAYLVLSNQAGTAFKSLKLDLVMFDADGVVARRLAVEAAPLAEGKTSIKVFDVAGMACAGISRVLLNSIMSCAGDNKQPGDCAALIQVSHRTKVPFFQ